MLGDRRKRTFFSTCFHDHHVSGQFGQIIDIEGWARARRCRANAAPARAVGLGKSWVVDVEGQPTAGLYAAGNSSASLMGDKYLGAGCTLGPAMTMAYLAAGHMMERVDALQSSHSDTAKAVTV